MTITQHLQCWDRRPSQDMSPGGAIEIRFQSPLRGYDLVLPNHPALEVRDYYREVPRDLNSCKRSEL